jgi:hypothetical protein
MRYGFLVRRVPASLVNSVSTCLLLCLLIFVLSLTAKAQKCTYELSPTSASFPAAGAGGSFYVTTDITCLWGATTAFSWITGINPTSGYGSGSVSYTVQPNTGPARTGTISVFGVNFTINQAAGSVTPALARPFDFDGDGKTDVGIFRPSAGEWWYRNSSDSQVAALVFGSSTDLITPADFTGDGKTDVAVFRPSTGSWFILRSEDGTFYSFPFGSNGDLPVPADYDHDSKADAAIYRPSSSLWVILRSSDGQAAFTTFGSAGDRPVPADYDGDGTADVGIWRPNGGSGGEWWIQRSTAGLLALSFGVSTDKAVAGDYTGDGKTDVAFYRPSTSEWFILRSEDFSFYAFGWGTSGDVPVPGDYDGDGKWDAGVFRPSVTTWFVNRSTSGPLFVGFGSATDLPLPNAYVR